MAVKFSQFSNISPTAGTYLVGYDGVNNIKIQYSSLLSGTPNYLTKWGSPSGLVDSLVFDNGTSVGIGTTSPTYKLDIAGSLANTGAAYLATNGSFSGFGTTSPQSSLHVSRTSGASLPCELRLTNTAGSTKIINNVGNTNIDAGGAAWSMTFSKIGNEIFRISASNNLLVGTTTDAGFKLDVNGTSVMRGRSQFLDRAQFNGGIFSGVTVSNVLTINTNHVNLNFIQFQDINANLSGSARDYIKLFTPNTQGGFASGTSHFMLMNPTINQTSGAGTIIGYRFNPTNTAVLSKVWSFYADSGQGFFNDGISIGTTSPNASALLDIISTTKGALIPRMTGSQVESIASPAQGLLAYSTDGSGTTVNQQGLWQYNGGSWQNTALKNDVRKEAWKFVNTTELFEDFIEWTTVANARWTTANSGTNSNSGIANINSRGDYDHGLISNSTGTTTTGYGVFQLGFPQSGATSLIRYNNNKYTELQYLRFSLPVLSDATDEYIAYVGLRLAFNFTSYNISNNVIGFVYDRVNYGDFWVLQVGANVVVTTTPVTTSIINMKLIIDRWDLQSTGGSTVRAYIDGTEVVASSGTYPVTTGLPTQGGIASGMGIWKSAGTTARTQILDAHYLYIEYLNDRFTL